MSIRRSTSVWELSRQTIGGLIVMLCLADHAHDDGFCYPSVARLSRMARLSKRSVYRAIRDAEAAGEVYVNRERYANRYVVTLGLEPQELIGGLMAHFDMAHEDAVAAQRAIAAKLRDSQHGSELSPSGDDSMVTQMTQHGNNLSPGVTDDAPNMVTQATQQGDTVSADPSGTVIEKPSVKTSQNQDVGNIGTEADYQHRWQTVLEALKLKMAAATYDAHLRGSRCIGPNGSPDRWRVVVRNNGSPAWLNGRLAPEIARVVERELGEGIRVTFEEARHA